MADPAPAPKKLRPLRGLLPFIAPYKRQVALALLFLVLAAGATLAMPYAVRLLVDNGNDEILHDWVSGIPFPQPKTGVEIAWNFDCITHGDTEFITNRGWLIDGKRKNERLLGRVKIWRMYFSGRTDVPPVPEFPDNKNGYRRGLIYYFFEPYDMRGIRNLSMRYKDTTKEDDSWAYVPAMRRVRRMSTAQRGDSVGGGDNTWDDTWGWDGHIRRNEYPDKNPGSSHGQALR